MNVINFLSAICSAMALLAYGLGWDAIAIALAVVGFATSISGISLLVANDIRRIEALRFERHRLG